MFSSTFWRASDQCYDTCRASSPHISELSPHSENANVHLTDNTFMRDEVRVLRWIYYLDERQGDQRRKRQRGSKNNQGATYSHIVRYPRMTLGSCTRIDPCFLQ